MKIIAIVQARTGSSRLPGKVLLPVNGRPGICRVMERTAACPMLTNVVLATSKEAKDDQLAELALQEGWIVFRGGEDDVLSRYVDVARELQPDVIVRVTGDNWAVDPEVIGATVQKLEEDALDLCNPFLDHTYPFGVGAEAATFDCLMRVDRATAGGPKELREHIFYYAYRNPEGFRIAGLLAPPSLRRPEVRLSVDTAEDYATMVAVYARVSGRERMAGTADFIAAWDDVMRQTAMDSEIRR